MGTDSSAGEDRCLAESRSLEQARNPGIVKLIPIENGPCISDVFLLKWGRDGVEKKRCVMKTLTGLVERDVYKIRVLNKKPMTVFCDTVTGSLFNWQGKCLSSSQRRIVRWQ